MKILRERQQPQILLINMKCILAVIGLLFGRFLTDIYAAGTGTEWDPSQQYVKQGHDTVLQCKYESAKLVWQKNVSDTLILIANQNVIIETTKYNVSVNPNTGLYYRLHILNAQSDDEVIYNCNAGINETYYIQLSLNVPPVQIYFSGLMNNKIRGIEGNDLLIRCIVVGGKPPPDVSILDGSMSNGIQEVSYKIPNIARDYHQKSIVCQATSEALDKPLTATVQLYLNLKPLTPIFNTNEVSTEETLPLTVSCKSYGSLPVASFTWTIGGNDVTSSSAISQTVTESNGTNTVTSTLTSSLDRSHNKQSIICNASNTVGSVSTNKTLDVKYPPDITVYNNTYTQNDAIRTVICNASGNPDSYTYQKWQHRSKYGELIRELSENKILELPDYLEISRYQDTGEYVCTASNGIKDKDGKVLQTSSGNVAVNAQPVFTSDTVDKINQFGEFNTAVEIFVNVYSVPKFTSYIWTRDGTSITIQNSAKYKLSNSMTIVKDEFHQKEIQLDGYNVTLTIRDLKAEDLANYTVTLQNEFGTVIHTIMLESASVPETPGNFTRISASTTSITVQWDPNADGGYKQTFYIQYRVQGSSKWSSVSAGEEDINEQRRRKTYEVTSLQEGKAYELRMFAENIAMKRSNVTDVLIAFTIAGSKSSVAAIVGGIAGCLIAIIIVLLVIMYVQKKRKENGTPSTKRRASSVSEEEDGLKDNILYESSKSDGLKKNVLYQSAGPDFESQKESLTSSEYAVVHKPNAIYAEVNKVAQPKKDKEKKQKDKEGKPKKAKKKKTKAMKNNPEEEYANSALPLRDLNNGEYANSTDSQGPSDHHTHTQGLEYADLTFGQISGNNKKQVIHGNDERTVYADVDHTKKAPPPPAESEYEETNIKHGKMA